MARNLTSPWDKNIIRRYKPEIEHICPVDGKHMFLRAEMDGNEIINEHRECPKCSGRKSVEVLDTDVFDVRSMILDAQMFEDVDGSDNSVLGQLTENGLGTGQL